MFGLTNVITLWLFASITATYVLLLILFWQKLFRHGLPNLLLRLLLLALCQILVVSTVGISINRSDGFYSSWTDLVGITKDFSAVATTSSESTILNASILDNGQNSFDGQVIIKDIVRGEQSGISNVVYIVLPKDVVYRIKNSKPIDLRRTRIVELLAGYPAQPEFWMKSLNIARALATAEKVNPGISIIGVIPAVNVAGKHDLECMNFPNGGVQTETWLSTDLHSFVSHRLGISTAKWGLMGVSTGGWCSVMLSIKHADLFYGAVSIAGYYRPALAKKIDPSIRLILNKEYVLPQLENAMTGRLYMLLIASKSDSFSFNETKKFLAMEHPSIQCEYIEIALGGHNARVWMSQLAAAIDWLKV